MTDPIIHFEIPADNVARAKKFYETIFKWKINRIPNMDYYSIIAKSKETGINGGMMKRKMPRQPCMNYISVKSIDATLKKVTASGGKIAMRPETVKGNAKMQPFRIAAFMDPEGNYIGLVETGAMPKKK